MGIFFSVKFHQKLHIILMVNFDHKKIFSLTNFHSHLIPQLSMVMHLKWILWRKWNDWSWTSMTIKITKRFFNQNYTSFSFPLPPFIITYQRGCKCTWTKPNSYNLTMRPSYLKKIVFSQILVWDSLFIWEFRIVLEWNRHSIVMFEANFK